MAVALAVAIGVAATIAGAIAHTETRYGEGADEYHLYGWPWDWKTDASEEILEFQRDNSTNYRYDDSGFALNVFIFTAAIWSIGAIIAEALLLLVGRQLWRLVRSSRR